MLNLAVERGREFDVIHEAPSFPMSLAFTWLSATPIVQTPITRRATLKCGYGRAIPKRRSWRFPVSRLSAARR
jgi:hypothetical protein